jgi:hypothetical protein
MLPWRAILLAMAIIGAGCATQERERRVVHPSTRTELSMRAVPEQEWAQFLADVVTARFPSGFTVLDAGGQWRGQDGKVYSERSRIVVVLHPSSREANRAIEEIRREFKARFGGEVLRTDTPAMVSY